MNLRSPAAGEDGGLGQRALLVVVSSLLFAVVIGLALTAAAGIRSSASALALASIPLAGALLLGSRGRRRSSAWLALGTTLLLLAWLMYIGDGMTDIVVVGWPAVVLSAGLLLRRRELYLYVAACLSTSGWVAWLHYQGRLQQQSPPRTYAPLDFAVLALVMILTAIAADLLIASLRRSLSEALTMARELRASEERFNRVFQASPAAMTLTRLSDRVVLDVNAALLHASGKSREELVGRPTTETDLWVDLRERDELYAALAEKGSFGERRVRYRRHRGDDGEALVSGALVEIDGEPCALFSALDVTARLRAEAARAASEERYRLISKLISDYTFSTRVAEDGTMQLDWVAGAFEKITGYSFDEYVARGGWRASLHRDDLAVDDEALERLARRETVQIEVRTLTSGGGLRWVRVYGHPAWDDEEDRLAGIHGAVKDITEQKQAELDRESLIDELETKNAELERFTYTVSHDLKSPLLTIRGFLGHVRSSMDRGDSAAAAQDLHRIGAAATRMGRLLDELLELSRIGRVVSPPVDCDFGRLADEAVSLCAGRLEPRNAEVTIQPGLPVVRGDRSRLVEVLQNLIDNAVKFTPAERVPRIEIGAREDEGRTVLFVSDQGMGLPPSHREKIFGLFDKLDPDTEGTGIGLALVHRIVQLHGGRTWVESEGPDRGCRFCFTLPEPGGD